MRFLIELAWKDLRSSGRSLWVFCACLMLGVSLVSASGGIYRQVSGAMLADTRMLLGGDLEIDSEGPLPREVLDWIDANGRHSLVIELYTMLITPAGDFVRVELQNVDKRYPLYGTLRLQPELDLAGSTAFAAGRWGVAIDQSLALRQGISVGDRVSIGSLEMDVRALVLEQPDRNLTADWRGPPVFITGDAIEAAGLIQPGSRVDYDYHVATDLPVERWRSLFYQRFPEQTWEVRTFEDRSERIAERLGQVASGLLIIGFSTLVIGGLGVYGSIQSYLQGKLGTIATLRSLGLRNRRLAAVYLLQVAILGLGASLAGCALGLVLALAGAAVIADQLSLQTAVSGLWLPNLGALAFGLLTAFCFAMPAVGRALAVSPASLFRNIGNEVGTVPAAWRFASIAIAMVIVALILLSLPDTLFGAGFVVVVGCLFVLMELLVRAIRRWARALDGNPRLEGHFALRLALANLHRPGAPLRSALLSLGSALTLLVACTLVVVSLLRTIHATIPAESPALVLYDISDDQRADVVSAIATAQGDARVQTAPLVRARIDAINGRPVAQLLAEGNTSLREALNNDHKLSYRAGNIDGISLIEGAWWAPAPAVAKMSLEDREARRLGIGIGDRIRYAVGGATIEAQVEAIHRQKGLQTRFWFEGILADGLLEPHIYRHVGAAFMHDDSALDAQRRIAAVAPNVVSMPTRYLLDIARDLLGQATAGLALVAGVSLVASLLVLASVIAAGRSRQVYDATVLHALGARISLIRRSLQLEFLLLALVTAAFSLALGSAIALPLLEWRMKLPSADLVWVGALTAIGVSVAALAIGARYLLNRLRLRPAELLRDR